MHATRQAFGPTAGAEMVNTSGSASGELGHITARCLVIDMADDLELEFRKLRRERVKRLDQTQKIALLDYRPDAKNPMMGFLALLMLGKVAG